MPETTFVDGSVHYLVQSYGNCRLDMHVGKISQRYDIKESDLHFPNVLVQFDNHNVCCYSDRQENNTSPCPHVPSAFVCYCQSLFNFDIRRLRIDTHLYYNNLHKLIYLSFQVTAWQLPTVCHLVVKIGIMMQTRAAALKIDMLPGGFIGVIMPT